MTLSSLESIVSIAREAGEKIRAIYASDFAVTHKDDDSPLTQADLAAHAHIVQALAALTPQVPVLSEEAADIAPAVRRAWTRYWLVDPLDGTREFVKRNGEFTVNIALIERGAPVLAVVHAPILGVTYGGERAAGAWKEEASGRRSIRTRARPARLSVVCSRSHRDPDTEALLARIGPHEAVSRGSSLKLGLVAEGVADLYPRFGPTSEWDTAAGQCVVEAAGGAVLRLPDLVPLRCNQSDSLLNPSFIAVGDGAQDWGSLIRG